MGDHKLGVSKLPHHHRVRTAIGDPPISRVTNVPEDYS